MGTGLSSIERFEKSDLRGCWIDTACILEGIEVIVAIQSEDVTKQENKSERKERERR